MKKTILILLSISLYSIFLSYFVGTFSRWDMVENGSTYQMSYKSYNGSRCIIDYIDKNTKESLFTGFEANLTRSCPDKAKIIEITPQEALQIFQTRLNDKFNPKIILPASNQL
jgi:hypothetical protein